MLSNILNILGNDSKKLKEELAKKDDKILSMEEYIDTLKNQLNDAEVVLSTQKSQIETLTDQLTQTEFFSNQLQDNIEDLKTQVINHSKDDQIIQLKFEDIKKIKDEKIQELEKLIKSQDVLIEELKEQLNKLVPTKKNRNPKK